jgi:hypothetical protein
MLFAREPAGNGYWTSLDEDERIRRILDFRQSAVAHSIIRRGAPLDRSDVRKRGGEQN